MYYPALLVAEIDFVIRKVLKKINFIKNIEKYNFYIIILYIII